MAKGKRKKTSKAGKILWWIAFLAAVAGFLGAGYQLISTLGEYRAAQKEYEKLEDYVTLPQEAEEAQSVQENESQESEGQVMQFAALKAGNEVVVGWIYVEEQELNYRFTQGEDNEYYLHRTTEKACHFAVSIFLDYANKANFSDCNSIVYGHNMK